LEGVSGSIRPGQMLAIMGSSGAGKTTLLNLLAGRLSSSQNCRTEGRVLVNGRKRDFKVFKKVAAYVEQDDSMFAELTVQEQVEFSAMLRLPRTLSPEEKLQRVDDIIGELGLAKVRHTLVGNALRRGISGGERKRLNVGIELVTDPSLICLDEPTSGLDSFNALNVMYTLRKLASHQRTVVSTIHQPRSNIYMLFDYLCLLAEGRVMYFGPSRDAVTYFAGLGFNCPSQFNPADYFVDLLSVDQRDPGREVRAKARIGFLGDVARSRQDGLDPAEVEDDENFVVESIEGSQKKFNSTWPHEIYYLCQRSFKLMSRERASNYARAGQSLVFSILLGVIWINIGRDLDPDDPDLGLIQAINGVLFFICINQAFGAAFAVIFVYPLERAVLLRERASATFRVSSFMISKSLVSIPKNVVFIMVFSLITYFMIGLRASAGAFFIYFVVLFLCALVAEGATLTLAVGFLLISVRFSVLLHFSSWPPDPCSRSTGFGGPCSSVSHS